MRLTWIVCLLCVLVGFMPATHAEDSKPPAPKAAATGPAATKPVTPTPAASKPSPATTTADDEFLEFLGSLDAEAADEDLLDYLSRIHTDKVAKAKKK